MPGLLPRIDGIIRPAGRVFYGWYLVSAAGGLQLLAGLLWMQSYGAYVVLLREEFGWSAALVAGAFAMTRIESGILGPLQGWLTDRYGPRVILGIGTVIFGVGFMLFSQVESLLAFYLTFALIALGSSLGGFATVMVAIVNWFNRHRAKAVAVSQIGFSLGGLCVPLVILSLEAFGWRATAFYSGVIVIVVGLPLTMLVRHRPGDYGDVMDGGGVPDGADGKPLLAAGPDFTARQAMGTAAFWLVSVGHASALLTVSSVMVHLVPHLTAGLNYSLANAGLVVSLMTVFQMAGQIGGGFLGDRFNKRLICVICMLSHMAALLLLAHADSWWMVVMFAVLHGLAWGVRGPQMVALRADYFGVSSFGTIMGFSSLIVMLGMSIGPIFAGYLYDIQGSYTVAFTVMGLSAMAGSLCFALAVPPVHPDSGKLSP